MTNDITSRPVVATRHGRVRGVWRPESAAFLGIPFAAPPVGEHRFAAPKPHPAWSDVRDADRYGPTPQRRPFGPEVTIPEPSIPGESTLNVNVFTPVPGDSTARLPVFVWIHGGGFFAGSPASPWYDGASFNRDGVVTVSVSYRLGFDGFGWIEDAPSNRGILDQIAALEWVQENIEAFGGDPGRVTIGGQSAGGSAVLTLLSTPAAQPLFSAAIAQSGVIRHRSLDAVRELGTRFAANLGVPPTRAGWSSLSEDQILDGQAELAAVPQTATTPDEAAVAIVRALTDGEPGSNLAFVPHIDGTLITQRAAEAIVSGVGADKPLLLGSNANEFTMVMNPLRDSLRGNDPLALLSATGLDSDAAAVFAGHYPNEDPGWLLGQLITERMFRMPLLDAVDARLTGEATGTWLYDFRWASRETGLSAHCLELPFVWDLLDAPGVEVLGSEPPSALAGAMHRAWVGFIRDGDPAWPACSPESCPGMVFDTESHLDRSPYRVEADLQSLVRP